MIWSRIVHNLRKYSSLRLYLVVGVLLLGVIALVSFTAEGVAQTKPTATPQPDWGKKHHHPTPTPKPTQEHHPTPTPKPTHPGGGGEHGGHGGEHGGEHGGGHEGHGGHEEHKPTPSLPPTGSDPTAHPLP